ARTPRATKHFARWAYPLDGCADSLRAPRPRPPRNESARRATNAALGRLASSSFAPGTEGRNARPELNTRRPLFPVAPWRVGWFHTSGRVVRSAGGPRETLRPAWLVLPECRRWRPCA